MNGVPPPLAVEVALSDLVERCRLLLRLGGRRVLGVTGTPGAGKSTLTGALVGALGDQAVLVGMDGFHLAQAELARLGRASRKGAPDTFDVDGYTALLARLRTVEDHVVYAPRFDRELEEPIGSAVPVPPGASLVITEGNYLLNEEHGWAGVRPQLDEVWFLDVTPRTRRERLVRRRTSFGHPLDEAEAWVRDVDEPNAAVVDRARERADRVLHLTTPL